MEWTTGMVESVFILGFLLWERGVRNLGGMASYSRPNSPQLSTAEIVLVRLCHEC